MKTVYQIDAKGYFVGVMTADESPLEPGVFLIPAGCVEYPPPEFGANQAAQFVDGVWAIQPDFVGTKYWIADGSEHEITDRGAELPAGALFDPPQPTLVDAKKSALSDIDTAAGTARSHYITVVPGQEATYILKESQARAYKAAGYPAADVASYPMVWAESQAVYGAAPIAAEIQSACDSIITQADAWIAKAAEIEQVRIRGKRAVSAAVDLAGALAARDAELAYLGVL